MWRTTMKSLGAHKRRLLSTALAVTLGVAFLAGTLVLGDTMTAGFSDLFAESNAGTDAVVRNATEVGEEEFVERGLVDAASLADDLAGVDGVAAAAPEIEAYGRIVGADGDPIGGNGPPTVAGNWIADDGLNPYDLAEGRAPDRAGRGRDRQGGRRGRRPGGRRHDHHPPARAGRGDHRRPGHASATPTAPARSPSRPSPPRRPAALLLPGSDGVTDIRLAAEPGVSQEELVERIRPALPADAEALTGAQLTTEMEDDIQADFLGFFEKALLAFAGISLVVATFSIYNTFSILVAQRTRESALLRALGASRGQVLRSIAVEALAVGIVASALGIAAGIGLASGLLALMDAAGMAMPASHLVVGTGSVVIAAVVGVVVTLVASMGPAVQAARTAPLAALRDAAIDRSAASWLRAGLGAVTAAAGIGLAVAGTPAARASCRSPGSAPC